MIIISGRLARECEIREGVSPKGRPYSVMNNCVFVANKELGRDVSINIAAWGRMQGLLVAQETPHERKVIRNLQNAYLRSKRYKR